MESPTSQQEQLWGFAQSSDGTLGALSKINRARTREELQRGYEEGGAVYIGKRETVSQIYRVLLLEWIPQDQEMADVLLMQLGENNPEAVRQSIGIRACSAIAA